MPPSMVSAAADMYLLSALAKYATNPATSLTLPKSDNAIILRCQYAEGLSFVFISLLLVLG